MTARDAMALDLQASRDAIERLVIGTSVKRTDLLGKVTGRRAVRGRHELPGMLHGKILRSNDRARDASSASTPAKALALPGVKAVLTHENVPRVLHDGSPHPRSASVTMRPVHPRHKVRYWGEGIAAVAATSEEIAEEALDLIEVEYEALPARLHGRGGDARRRAVRSTIGAGRQPGAGAGGRQARRRRARLRRGRPRDRRRITRRAADAGLHGAERLRLRVGRQRQAHGLDLDPDRRSWCAASWPRCSACRCTRCACWSTTWAAASAPSRTCSSPSSCARCWPSRRAGRCAWSTRARKRSSAAARAIRSTMWLKQGFKKDGTIAARRREVVFNSGAYGSHGPGVTTRRHAMR